MITRAQSELISFNVQIQTIFISNLLTLIHFQKLLNLAQV